MNINVIPDLTTGYLLEICQLFKTNDTKLWRDGSFNELSYLSQVIKKKTIKGTNTIHFISPDQKPTKKKATYDQIVGS